MRAYLKLLCILAPILVIGFGFMSVHSANPGAANDTLTLVGDVSPDTFLNLRDRLVQSSARNKTFLITGSGGGSWESALALGVLIHKHGWNVEVVDHCASSCANFIFPAGKVKYLHRDSLLLFHGGPYQHNLLEKVVDAEKGAAVNPAPTEAKDPAARMEGHVTIDDKAVQRLQVLEFLSITNVTNAVDLVTRLRKRTDEFYEELGVNPVLPVYGQIGKYEPTYKSYKYGGFIYRLDSLGRLGIRNIELKDGEWRPELHRDYRDVYEVTYP